MLFEHIVQMISKYPNVELIDNGTILFNMYLDPFCRLFSLQLFLRDDSKYFLQNFSYRCEKGVFLYRLF